MATGTHQQTRAPHRIGRLLQSHTNMLSSNVVHLILRAAQVKLALVVLALSSYVTSWYNSSAKSAAPGQVGWLLFVSLFSLISVAVLEGLPRFAPRFHHPYVALSLEFGNAIFYAAGFISLSTFMGGLLYCRGSVCGAARADVAFGFFEFLLWGASSFRAGRDVYQKLGFRRRRNSTQAPLGAPPMKEGFAP